jgi:hypothetical protein
VAAGGGITVYTATAVRTAPKLPSSVHMLTTTDNTVTAVVDVVPGRGEHDELDLTTS